MSVHFLVVSGEKPGRLAEELSRILIDDLFDGLYAVMSALHFEGALGDGEGVGVAPVASGVHPEALGTVQFEHVDGAVRAAFTFRVERHTGPVTSIENVGDGVLLDVIDDHFGAVELRESSERIKDETGALELILQVRGVDEDG